MSSNLPRLTVRMNQDLIDKINKISEQEKRSTNQQIVYVIEKYIQQYEKEHGKINTELSISKIG